MIKIDEKLLNQSINRIEISDNATEILNRNKITTLEDLCNKTKTDLKKLEINQGEINKMDIELQLLGLKLKNSL